MNIQIDFDHNLAFQTPVVLRTRLDSVLYSLHATLSRDIRSNVTGLMSGTIIYSFNNPDGEKKLQFHSTISVKMMTNLTKLADGGLKDQ